MTDDRQRTGTEPFGTLEDAADAALGRDHDDDDAMPAHEIDRDDTVGGGVMSEGGTSIDRGTGTLTGDAQGDADRDEDDDRGSSGEDMTSGFRLDETTGS